MENKQKSYKRIWVAQPSHDFSILKDSAEEIKFITTGYEENISTIIPLIKKAVEDLDPNCDAIVAVGKVNTCLIIGYFLGLLGKEPPIGVYEKSEDGGKYKWIRNPITHP